MPIGNQLQFDERGVAADGRLSANGVEIDLRANGLVAILVSRAAIAPDALYDDDEAIRRRVLDALRLLRLLRLVRLMTLVIWVGLLVLGLLHWLDGDGGVFDIFAPAAIATIYIYGAWRDRRAMRAVSVSVDAGRAVR